MSSSHHNQNQIVYYVPDLAALFGKTESAVRNHLRRRDWSAVPAPVKIGGRVCWRWSDISDWLDSKTPIDNDGKKCGPGRPPKNRGQR